jgi:hypothetical protein
LGFRIDSWHSITVFPLWGWFTFDGAVSIVGVQLRVGGLRWSIQVCHRKDRLGVCLSTHLNAQTHAHDDDEKGNIMWRCFVEHQKTLLDSKEAWERSSMMTVTADIQGFEGD